MPLTQSVRLLTTHPSPAVRPVAKIINSAKFNSEGNFVVPISNDAPNYYGMDISDALGRLGRLLA